MSTFQTTIEWPFQVNGETDSCEREITVEYEYHRAHRGAHDSLCGVRRAGPPLEPDEPATVELVKVLLHSPGPVDRNATEDILDELSEAQRERLEIQCLEQVASAYEREQEERNEYHR